MSINRMIVVNFELHDNFKLYCLFTFYGKKLYIELMILVNLPFSIFLVRNKCHKHFIILFEEIVIVLMHYFYVAGPGEVFIRRNSYC